MSAAQGAPRRLAAVFGASSPLGRAVVERLLAAGWRVRASSRRTERLGSLEEAGAEAIGADLADPASVAATVRGCEAVVFAPDLRLSAPAARVLPGEGVRRAVLVSSHNVTLDAQNPVYASLLAAEASLAGLNLDWTVLRPTMIYGACAYQGLISLARLARGFPVLPVFGSGRALQQPVFYEDLAVVAAWLLERRGDCAGRIVPVGGPEVLPLTELTAAVSRAAGRAGQVVHVPPWAARIGRAALGKRFPLDAMQIARAEKDKHVTEPSPLPAAVLPATSLAQGLARLFAELNAEAR